MRPVDLIVIHCAATPDGRPVTPEEVDRWHRDAGFRRADAFRARFNRDLASIGYHFLIGSIGALYTGRHLDEVGAHAAPFNTRSVGICMAGTTRFALGQWEQLALTVGALVRKLGVPQMLARPTPQGGMTSGICGHRDLPDVHKACPGFDVGAWLSAGMQPAAEHVMGSA